VGEGGHQVLAVESIHDAAVTRDGVGKVLERRDVRVGGSLHSTPPHAEDILKTGGLVPYFYFEGSLEAAGEEAAERPDERAEGREEDAVDLERVHLHGLLQGTDSSRLVNEQKEAPSISSLSRYDGV